MGSSPNPNSAEIRPIRSFTRREGRITAAQRKALDELLPRYGASKGVKPLDFNALFQRCAPVHLEIGFGNGGTLLRMATNHPEHNYFGIEVHRPGVGHLLVQLQKNNIANVRVVCRDAAEVLAEQIPDQSIAATYIFFPDPWPKKKHHKRRLVQPPFVAQLTKKLIPGGLLYLATDWQHYAEQMLQACEGVPDLINCAGKGRFSPRPECRPLTRFEQRGQSLGHNIWDLVFKHEE